MKAALFARTGNDRVVVGAGAEIFAALMALQTQATFVADQKSALRHRISCNDLE
jgi:hypothetical protein